MIFSWVVRYMSLLKSVPLAPHVFDSFIRLWTLLTFPSLLKSIDRVEEEVLRWEGCHSSLHPYGGIQLNYHTTEMGHIHSNGIVDILYSKKTRDQLVNQGMTGPHHVFANSGWTTLRICKSGDTQRAIKLLRLSYLRLRNQSVLVTDVKSRM